MLWLLAVPLLLVPSGPAKSDPCLAMIPASLRAAIAKEYRGYRLPRRSDNLAEDVRYHTQHGGNGCLGATAGDFDGDGEPDVALLLTSTKYVRFIVAFARGSTWILESPWKPTDAQWRNRLYVATEPPGKYDDLGLADEPEEGQVDSFTCKTEVPSTGTTESTEIVFWKGPQGWVHVWISD